MPAIVWRPVNAIVMFTVLSFLSLAILAQSTFQSSEKPVYLIELYTSEGCYSCPPADRWLSSLKNHDNLFETFVPLAFHVDYWNHLGWRDQYSRQAYSQRQRRYFQLGQVSGVYTPGMFVDGYEWRAWRQLSMAEFRQDRSENNAVGVLRVTYREEETRFEFRPTSDSQPAKAFIALLGADIDAPIAAGENKGKTLQHDFVVLDLQQTNLERTAEGNFVGTLPSFNTDLQAPRFAIAAWITNADNSHPIQATGGWLNNLPRTQ